MMKNKKEKQMKVGKTAIWDMNKNSVSVLGKLISMLYLSWQRSPATKDLPIPNIKVTKQKDGKFLFELSKKIPAGKC